MMTDRRQRLLLVLNKQPQITLTELAAILAVSPRTLAGDLKALASECQPVRIRGDEVLFDRPGPGRNGDSFAFQSQVNQAAKRSIARWAAGLVKDGDTILMDASTTVFNMVPTLAERRGLVVLTNGIETGRCLAENTSNTVLLVAGVVRSDGASVVGPLYEPVLRNRHITAAFVSCKGFSLAAGLTEPDANEAAIKCQMVGLAQSTVALIDASKFGQVYQAPFARADQVTHIFSDDSLEPYWVQQVQEASIVLTLCHPAS
jgi:DeoR/GlpR family transcriptional regulator of sugar metabolism